MPGIDIHCHLTHMDNPESVAKEAVNKLSAVITATAEIQHAEQALELHKKFPNFVFVALGLHPEYCMNYSTKEIDDYIEFIKHNRKHIVAIGEVGLDYSWLTKKEEQEKSKEIFVQMIGLAKELKLPLEIHSRNSENQKTAIHDVLKILTTEDAKDVVMHCFSGNEDEMKYSIENGYYISFATIVCRSKKHQRLAGACNIESMLLETDAPWLDPDSRELKNRPWKIHQSAELIAEIKQLTMDEVLHITEENAKRIFGLD